MPINQREIIALVSDLCRNENIRVSVSSSVRGALIAGSSTLAGGLLLGGPVGLAIGGLFGVVTNAATSPHFRPVADILMNDLTPAQQAVFVNRVRNIIQNVGIEDVVLLSTIVLSNQSIRGRLITLVQDFVRTDLQLQLI